VLFHIQDKPLRSLLSGMFFSCKEELFPHSPAAMLGQNSYVGEVVVLRFESVQRFARPGKRGKSSNEPRAVPSEEVGRRARICPPDDPCEVADQRSHDQRAHNCRGARLIDDHQGVLSGIGI